MKKQFAVAIPLMSPQSSAFSAGTAAGILKSST